MKHEEIIIIQQECNQLLSSDLIKLTHDDPSLLKNSGKYFHILLNHPMDGEGAEALFQLGLLYEKITTDVRELFYRHNNFHQCPDSFRVFSNTNSDMANKLFAHAADFGHLQAQLKAGHYFMDEKYFNDCRTYHVDRQKILEEDKQLAFFYFKLAADQGDFSALKIIMQLYLDGWGVAQSDEKAIEYLDKARNKCGDSHSRGFSKESELVHQIEQRRRTLSEAGSEASLQHAALMKDILERLARNDPQLIELIFDDKKLNDKDVLLLQDALKQNTFLQKIIVKSHELTTKSYPVFLDILKNNLCVTTFSCSIIFPLSVGSSRFYGACRNILSERVQKKFEITSTASSANNPVMQQ